MDEQGNQAMENLTIEDNNPFLEPTDMTDIVFVVEDKKIHYTKNLLCFTSPVFSAMLNSDFAEKNMSEIPLPGKNYDDMVLLFRLLHPAHTFFVKLKGRMCSVIVIFIAHYIESCLM